MAERQPPRRRAWLRRLLLVAAMAALLWLGAFLHFVAGLPRSVAEPDRPTDAVVVLTGGAARLDAGLDLLLEGKARRMFVSGVNPGTSKTMMRQVAGRGRELFECCVDLGFEAMDTEGNAVETATWVQRGGYGSLRVVTASYHMPRSLMELRRRLPGIELVPHPVFPPQFKLEDWWAWPGTASLLVEEFDKYLVALLRARLDAWSGGRVQRWLDAGEGHA